MGGSSKLAPPAQSSACPEGPKRRRREGVNPMLDEVPSAGGPANPCPHACTTAMLQKIRRRSIPLQCALKLRHRLPDRLHVSVIRELFELAHQLK